MVGQLSSYVGDVALLPAGSATWIAASGTRPISSGDQLWVGENSRAEILAGPDALRIGPGSELAVLDLREQEIQVSLRRGTAEFSARAGDWMQRVEIDTPNLAFQLDGGGEVRLDVYPQADSTAVALRAGQGSAYGDAAAPYPIRTGRQVRFVGQHLTVVADAPLPPPDAFDRWVADRNRVESASISANYVSPWMTGYEGLDAWGTWQDNADLGPVWFPRVGAGWVPYRHGRWAWIAPWGWTWIADEPWGFAPFHYGRWAWIDSAWAWVPGPAWARAMYAPALVGFVQNATQAPTGSKHTATPQITAWFPLGPGQLYRPPYAYSPAYLVAINRCTVIRARDADFNVQRRIAPARLAPQALTVIPSSVFVRGESVDNATRLAAPTATRRFLLANQAPVQPLPQSVLGGARPRVAPRIGHPRRPVLATRQPPLAAFPASTVPSAQTASQQPWPGEVVRVVPYPPRYFAHEPRVEPPQTVMPLERAGMVPPTGRMRLAPHHYFPYNPTVEAPQTMMPLERAGMLPPPPVLITPPPQTRFIGPQPGGWPSRHRPGGGPDGQGLAPVTPSPLERAGMAP